MKKRPSLPDGSTIKSATPAIDDDGGSIIRVQLISGENLTFDKADYADLVAAGITSCPWFTVGRYVAVRVRSKVTLLQRVVVDAVENERVWFRSDDRSNLRQKNLQIRRERNPRLSSADERTRLHLDQTLIKQLFDGLSDSVELCVS